jgi:hypothetical protein
VLARTLEAAGLATVSVSLVREHTVKVLPPRALWVPFPFGLPLGHAGDTVQQRRVLLSALSLFLEPSGPVLRDLAGEEEDERGAPLQASDAGDAGPATVDVATELSLMRQYYERRLEGSGRTTVGLTRIPHRRFRGVVGFLEAFADGGSPDMGERPADVEPHLWVRWCVDDLKALYLEGRLAMMPSETTEEAARWLWSETALGVLIRRVAVRMEASSDPPMRAAAYGIAR